MKALLKRENKNLYLYLLFISITFSHGIFAQPIINSFSPTSGPVNTTVTITGSNFGANPANDIVYFGSVRANVLAASVNSLTVIVPTGASYQPITVTVNGLISASGFPFTLTYSGGGPITSTTYETRKNFSTGNFPQVVLAGDFDGDGKPDLVTPNTNSNTISVLRNTSSSGIVSFEAKLDYITGGSPANVSIADLDGDGKLDIAVLNSSSNTVSVYRNTSTNTISFAAKIDFPTGTTPYGIAIADFNGDGKQDMAVANYGSNSVSILKNNSSQGTISFAAKADFLIGINPYTVMAGDVDGDNKVDLVSTNSQSKSISILRNISDINGISFASKIDLSTIANPSTATIADFDGDGKQDIAVGSETLAFVSVYRNLSVIGNISLASKIDYSIAGVTFGISAGDLNGDEKPDIIACFSTSATISLIENTSTPGALSFSQKVNYTSDSGPFYTIVQDIDGDGVNDFVSANSNSNSISVFRNNLNGSLVPTISSFTPTSATSGTIVTIKGTNFNGATAVRFGGIAASSFTVTSSDTIKAIVATGVSGDVSITTVTGTATLPGFTYFTPVVITTPVITSFSPQSGSIGATVIITGINFSPVVSDNIVYFGAVKANVINASSTSLAVTVPSGTTYEPITVTINSFTGYSNKPFIVTFPGTTGTFLPGAFSNRIDSITNNDSYGISISDLDGDGKPDLISANYQNGTISIIKNTSSTGKIQLGSKIDLVSGSNTNRVKTADLDGDGKPDILVTNFSSNYVSLYRNTSSNNNITFANKIEFATELAPEDVSVGDIDGDGRPDIVVVNGNSHTVSIFRNTSTSAGVISFAPYVTVLPGTHPIRVSIVDMDNDGKPDLVIANGATSSSSVSVLRNLSSIGVISFATKVDFPAGTRPYGLAVGDLDGDGKPDIAIINNGSSTLSIFKNLSTNGIISLSSKIDLSTGTFPQDVSITDLDGDGKPDIAVTNTIDTGSVSVSVYKNVSSNGTLSFLQSVNYNSTNARGIGLADFDGDGKPDIATANYNSVSILRNKTGEPPATTTTTVASSLNPSAFGQSVTFTATVTTVSGTPTGTVSFYDGTILFGTGTLSGNTATYPISGMSVGSHTITAKYDGNSSYATSSSVLIETINGATPIDVPVITSFTPQSGAVGTSVTITGNNFGSTSADNLVYFGGLKANITSANYTSIVITVPPGTTYQPISVTTNNLTAYSNQFFITTYAGGSTAFDNNSFSAPVQFVAGNSPRHSNVADFDGDGKPDLLIANQGSNTISVLRNVTGSSSIGFIKNDIVTSGSFEIGIADFNGDGKLDFAITNFNSGGTSIISIYKNTSISGNISFAPKVDFQSGNGTSGIAIGDLDSDGKPDMVVTSGNSGIISIFRNSSSVNAISFDPKIDITNFDHPTGVAITDLQADGKPDIIVGNFSSSSISAYKNLSTPGVISFGQRVNFPSSDYVGNNISVGDLNNDGKPDIVYTNPSLNSVSVLKNTSVNGIISLEPDSSYSTATFPLTVTIGDLNGDGKPDLAVSSNTSNKITVWKNQTVGSSIIFQDRFDYAVPSTNTFISLADFDLDGKLDLAVPLISGFAILINKIGQPVLNSTTTSVTSSLNPSLFGQSVSFTATVSTPSGTPTGTLSFYEGTTFLGVGTISNNTANYSTSVLTTGSHNIIATYNGNSNFAASTSSVLAQVVTNNQPPLSIITYTGNTTFCEGGSLPLNANTGTGLTYQWYKNNVLINGAITPTYNVTTSGNYTVIVTNSNSISATSNIISIVVVPAPTTPTINAGGTTTFCQGGSVTLTSNAASRNQWYKDGKAIIGSTSTTLVANSSGSYTAIVSSNGCSSPSSNAIVVTTNSTLTQPNTILGANIVCQNSVQTYSVIASTGATGYTWTLPSGWSGTSTTNSITTTTGNSSGTIFVSANNSCGSSTAQTLNVGINSTPTIALQGDTMLISSTAPNYQWFFNNNALSGEVSNTLRIKNIGFYRVETSPDKICWSPSLDFPILILPPRLLPDTLSMEIYPNPAVNFFNVVVRLQQVTTVTAFVTISDVSGNVVLQTNKLIFFGNEIKIPITLNATGIFFVKININGNVKTLSVILQ